MRRFGVKTFQAEDEIAAVGVAIGASYGGAIGITGTSGPGICLKSEAINLAVMTELPLVIVNIQRGGPSTGLPTKTEQSDLLQAMFGRNGDSPVAIVAPQSPADCFDMAIEAVRIATRFMCPVFYLSDGYLANGSEPWKIPAGRQAAEDRDHERDRAEQRGWTGPGHESGDGEAGRASSCRTSATSTSRGRGRCRARPASNTASAASRSRTSPATSTTSRPTTST